MHTIAFIEGLASPMHLLILLFVLALPIGLVFLILWIVRKAARSSAPGAHIAPFPPTDAALQRRRQELELDRMAIENEERRRKLNQ